MSNSGVTSNSGVVMSDSVSISDQLELIKSYLATFQTCKNCSTCFQNRHNVYEGATPLCKRCRTHGKKSVVMIQYNTIDSTIGPAVEMTFRYVIDVDLLNANMIESLHALHGTVVITERDTTGDMVKYNTYYENDRGALFHETFPTQHIQDYRPLHHHIIQTFEYPKQLTD